MPWPSQAWPSWPPENARALIMAAPPKFPVDEREVEFSAIRAQGAGGQNVNKVSSAVHLRFDIHASSLPDAIKERLLCLSDSRITQEGVLVLKAQQHRTQEMNRSDALARLQEVVDGVSSPPKARRATKPTYGSKQRRLESKSQRSATKGLRGPVKDS
jgi:ribosome-associated protein